MGGEETEGRGFRLCVRPLPSAPDQMQTAGTEGMDKGYLKRQQALEYPMANEHGDDDTQKQHDTAYASQSGSGAKPGFVLSAWSLVVGGAFLVLILVGLLAF